MTRPNSQSENKMGLNLSIIGDGIVSTTVVIGAICGFLTVAEKFFGFLNKAKRWWQSDIKKWEDSVDNRLANLELGQLKIIICNKDIPISERLIAGGVYIKRGGNGEIKTRLEHISKTYQEELSKQEKK